MLYLQDATHSTGDEAAKRMDEKWFLFVRATSSQELSQSVQQLFAEDLLCGRYLGAHAQIDSWTSFAKTKLVFS